MARTTGIGGVFFEAQAPASLKTWYADHLTMTLRTGGGVVVHRDVDAE